MNLFKKKSENIELREYAASKKPIGPTPEQRPYPDSNNAPSFNAPEINVGRKAAVPRQPIAGQSSPDQSGSGLKGKNKKSNTKFFLLVFAVCVVMCGSMFFLLTSMNEGGGIKGSQPNLDQADSLKLMEERKQLEEKLALADTRYKEAQSMNQRLDERLKAIEAGMGQGTSVDITGTSAVIEELKKMQESQENLRSQIAALSAQKKSDDLRPKEGSSTASISFNRLAEVNAAKQKEQAELDEIAANSKAPYNITAGLPSGARIAAKLDTTIMSSTIIDRYFVTATSSQPTEVVKGLYLPAGTKFIGKPRPDMASRRIVVDIDKLIVGYREVDIKASMLDYRGSPGLVTKYVDPLNNAIWPIVLTSFATAASAALMDMKEGHNSITGESEMYTENSVKNAMLEGAGQSMQSIGQMLYNKEARKSPVIFVKAGIDVFIQFADKLEVSRLIEAGVLVRHK